jgi:hypothetical protein
LPWNLHHSEFVVEETQEEKVEADMQNAEDNAEAEEVIKSADAEELADERANDENQQVDPPGALQKVHQAIKKLPMKFTGSTADAIAHALSMNLTVNGRQWALLHDKLLHKNYGKPIRIGVVGGSTTAGGTNPKGGLKPSDPLWFQVFATWLAKTYGVKTQVFNAAVGGSTTMNSFYSLDTKVRHALPHTGTFSRVSAQRPRLGCFIHTVCFFLSFVYRVAPP